LKRAWHRLAALVLLVAGAAAQAAPLAFDYRCDAAAAAAMVPAALPDEGWRNASEEEIALDGHATPCWLRVAPGAASFVSI